MMLRLQAGRRFGSLVVLAEGGRDKHGGVMWRCRCECGTEREFRSRVLVTGKAISCGCSRIGKKATKTHNIKCAFCGQRFWGRAGTIYCGQLCRASKRCVTVARRKSCRKLRKVRGLTAFCRICGLPFVRRHANRDYCSNRCFNSSKRDSLRLYARRRANGGKLFAQMQLLKQEFQKCLAKSQQDSATTSTLPHSAV